MKFPGIGLKLTTKSFIFLHFRALRARKFFVFRALRARKTLVGVRGGEAPVARLAKRTRGVDRYLPGCSCVTRPPFFPKLFAKFDAFLRQRGTWGRHSELLIGDCDSIFVSLS